MEQDVEISGKVCVYWVFVALADAAIISTCMLLMGYTWPSYVCLQPAMASVMLHLPS